MSGGWPARDGVLDLGDLYFRVADSAAELAQLKSGELAVIPGIWGHRAGSPRAIPADLEFLRSRVRDWLDR